MLQCSNDKITICFWQRSLQISFISENLKSIKVNMAAMNLKPLCDFMVLCYGTNVIGDLEFILLYDYSQSREIYPYQKFNQYNLEIFDEVRCVSRQSAAKKLLQIILKQCSYCQKDFFILVVCLTWYHFLKETLHICVIFNYILDYLYSRFNHLFSTWNQDIL